MPQITDNERDAARQEFIRRGEDLADALTRLMATVPDSSADIVRIDELGFCDIPRRYNRTDPEFVIPGLPEVIDPSASPEEINEGLDELINELIGDPESPLPHGGGGDGHTFLTDVSAIYRQPKLPEPGQSRGDQCRIAIVEFAADIVPVPFEPGIWKVRPGDPVGPDTIIGRCRQERRMKPMKSIFKSGVVRKDPKDGGFGRLFKTVNSRHIIIDCIEYCESGSSLAGNDLDIMCPGGMKKVEEAVHPTGGSSGSTAATGTVRTGLSGEEQVAAGEELMNSVVNDPLPSIRVSSWEKAMSAQNQAEFEKATLEFTEELQTKFQDINTPFSLVTDPLVYSLAEFAVANAVVYPLTMKLILKRYELQRDLEQERLKRLCSADNIKKTEGEHPALLALGSENMRVRDRIMADAMFVCEFCIDRVEKMEEPILLLPRVKSDPGRDRCNELLELAEPVADSSVSDGSMMKEFREMMNGFIEKRTEIDDEGRDHEVKVKDKVLLEEFRQLEDLYIRARNAYFENHIGPDLTYLSDVARGKLWTQSVPCIPEADNEQSGYDAEDPEEYLQAQIDWNPPGCPEVFVGTDLGEDDIEMPETVDISGPPEVRTPPEFAGKQDAVGRFMKKNGMARGYAEWPEKKDFELDGIHYDLYTFQNVDDLKDLMRKNLGSKGRDADPDDWTVECPVVNLDTSIALEEPETPEVPETWTGGGAAADEGSADKGSGALGEELDNTPAVQPAQGAGEDDLGKCPDRPVSENLSGASSVEITELKYWVRYCGIATLMTVGFLATGLVIAGTPIPLPCIYIPIYVTSIPKVKLLVVIGLAIRGIAILPMIIYVNMSSENNSAVIPVTLALMMVKDEFMAQLQKLNLCVPDLADGFSNIIKADNTRLLKEQERYKKSYAALRAVQLPSRQMIIEYFKESVNREMEQMVERATDTYKDLKKQGKALYDEGKAGVKAVGTAIKDTKESAKNTAKEVGKAVNDTAKDAKKAVNDAKEDVKEAYDNAKDAVRKKPGEIFNKDDFGKV